MKLRWLRKGLPSVGAGDGRIPGGAGRVAEELGEDERNADEDEEGDDKMAEKEAMRDMGKTSSQVSIADMGIPALDAEQEYEWKWKVSLGQSSHAERTSHLVKC